MAYDLDVVATLETKRALLEQVERERWLAVFGHEQKDARGLSRQGRARATSSSPSPSLCSALAVDLVGRRR